MVALLALQDRTTKGSTTTYRLKWLRASLASNLAMLASNLAMLASNLASLASDLAGGYGASLEVDSRKIKQNR
jgi:hypothetical protein